MNVLAICGSPRSGSTEFMLSTIINNINKFSKENNQNTTTELILLKDKNIKYCTGCEHCYGTDKPCHLEDDMQEIIPKLINADVLILGSPNYYYNVSGLMKSFIDRLNQICKPNKLDNKCVAFVAVGSRDVSETKLVIDAMSRISHKTKTIDSIVAQANTINDLKSQTDILNQIKDLSNKICSIHQDV